MRPVTPLPTRTESPGRPKRLGLGFVEAMAGRVESAQAILETLTAETRLVADSRIAAIHVALGNLPAAASVLGRAQSAQSEGDWHLGWARGDQRWAPFRGKLTGF
jgi:hypothetical protein